MAVTLIAGLASVGSAMVAAGAFAIGWGAAFTAFAIGAGLSLVSRALMPKPDLGAQMAGQSVMTREAAHSRKIIYGRARIGGNVVYLESTGDDKKYLWLVTAIAGHEIDAYEQVWFNDQKIWDGGSYVSDWGSYVDIGFYKGDQTSADNASQRGTASLVSNSTKWTDNHKLLDTAYMVVKLTYDQEKFAQGLPNISTVVRGKKVWHPSHSSPVWSQNPALCVRDYLTDTKYGLGESSSNIASINTALGVCDEAVDLAAGGTQPRYTLDGVIDTGNSIKANIENMVGSMIGRLVYSGGKFEIHAGEYVAPTVTIDESMMIGEISVQTKQSRRSAYNGVKGVFLSEEDNYILADYPAQISSTYAAQDGDPIYLDMPLPYTVNNVRAQRIAQLALRRSRQQESITIPCNLNALKFKVGDNISVTNTRLGYSAKVFEVVGYSMGFSSDQMVVNVDAIETASSIWSWDEDEEVFLGAGEVDIYDGTSTTAPASIAVTADTFISSDGTSSASFDVSWPNSVDAFVDHYVVEWKVSTDSSYFSQSTKTAPLQIVGLDPSKTYDVRVKAVNGLSVSSSYVSAQAVPAADTTAPSVPTSISATAGYKSISLKWTNPSEKDFNNVEIYRSTASDGTYAEVSNVAGGFGSKAEHLDGGLADATAFYYKFKSVDLSGNKSAFSAIVNATTNAASIDGSDGKSTFTAPIFKRASSAPSAPSGGSFNFGTNTLTPPSGWSTTVPSGTDPIYQANFQFSITGDTGSQTAGTWSTPVVIAENGTDGTNGLSTFTFAVHKRASSSPSTPSGGSYNFGTNTITAPSGWSEAIPSGTDPIYISSTRAQISGATGTDSSLSWTAPIVFAINGDNGGDGVNTAPVYAYKRSSSTLGSTDKPTTTRTWTFANASFGNNDLGNSWTGEVPSGTDDLYICAAVASSTGATDSVVAADWSAPQVLGTKGDDGDNGVNTAVVYGYKRSASTVTDKPSTTRTWTFSSGEFNNNDLGNSFTGQIPSGTDELYVCTAVASSVNSTDSVTGTSDWSAPQLLAAEGTDGTDGFNTAVVYGYKRSSSAVTDKPSTTRTWTFSTGTFNNNDLGNDFTGEIPTGTNDLYACTAVATSQSSTDSVTGTSDWSAPQLLSSNGDNGAAGVRNASGYVYYSLSVTGNTGPSAPTATAYNFTTGAFTNLNASGGDSGTWSRTPPINTGGDAKYWATSYYVTEATYNGTQTITFGTVFNSVTFDGLVTFTNLNTALASEGGNVTTIDGGLIETDSIVVSKLSGDVTEVYPIGIEVNNSMGTSGTTTYQDIWIPAPSLGISKRQRISADFSFSIQNSSSTNYSAYFQYGLQYKGKTNIGTSVGTVTHVSFPASYRQYVSLAGNVLDKIDNVGGVAKTNNGAGTYGVASIVGVSYDADDDKTYVLMANIATTFATGDTLYFSVNRFESAGTFVANYTSLQTKMIFANTTERFSLPLQQFFGSSTTATNVRPYVIASTNMNNLTGTFSTVKGTMENIA